MRIQPTSFLRNAARPPKAFTLIEFVGVLAVLSILALVLVPVVIRHLDIAAVQTETATLNSISNAIVASVLRNDQIPGSNTWFAAPANSLALSPASITSNPRNFARAYLIDPGGWFGSVTLPYNQPPAGTIITNSARIMIVSSLSADLPGASSPANFADIWNTVPGTIPSTWTGWPGRGDDLLIARLNLQPLFCQLLLVNRDTNTAAYTDAAFTVNGGPTSVMDGGSISNAYYLSGSVVSLLNIYSGSTNLQTSFILTRSRSFVHDRGFWGGEDGIGPGTGISGTGLAALFTATSRSFIAAADSQHNSVISGAGGDQEQVLAAMINFMSIYALWAAEQYSLHGMSAGQAKNHLSLYIYLQQTRDTLNYVSGYTLNTNSFPYYSGLLY